MFDLIQRIPPWVWITLVAHVVVLGTVAYLILLERKIASWVQDRIGPNRVGLGFGIVPWLKDKHMFGLGQPLADGLKFLLKEDYRPKNVDKVLFTLAPAVMIITVIISIAVIPWGGVKGGVTTLIVPAGQSPAQAVAPSLPAHHRIISAWPTGTGNAIRHIDRDQVLAAPVGGAVPTGGRSRSPTWTSACCSSSRCSRWPCTGS